MLFKLYRLILNINRLIYSHTKRLFLTALYSTAAAMRLPWAYAYYWVALRCRPKLFCVVDADVFDKPAADKIYHYAVQLIEKACSIRANYVEAVQLLGYLSLMTGRTDQWLASQHRLIEYQEQRAKLAGVDTHNIRFIEAGPIFSTMGNTLTLDAWVKSGLLGLRPPWRTVVLVEPEVKNMKANPCLLDYWKKYYEFVEDPDEIDRLKPLVEDLRQPHEFYIPCGDIRAPYTHSAAVWIQAEWEKQDRPPLLELSDEHRQRGWDALEELGISRGSWFVTTHVREGGFKGREGFRDSDIATYFDAFREVTSKGGWVIRLGDSSMAPLPPMERVLDYALSPEKSDWMDVFLLASARFMIGTSSGPTTVSYVFGVPVVMTNNLPTAATYLGRQDYFLPRLLRRIEDGRYLNLEELMGLPYSMASWGTVFTNVLGVEVIPNEAEEITDVVKEMLSKLDGTLSYTDEEEQLQRGFKAITAEREVMIGFPGFEVQCRLGREFLYRHRHLVG